MSILFWNYRGASSAKFLHHAKELVVVHRFYIVVIVEPKINGIEAERIIR